MKDLISVIVPIYNVEKYLDKCIESIVKQTYKNLEIILVVDGSPDNSLDICNKWGQLDERIIIINKQNGGLSSARNAGIDAAKGTYLTFIDSDDYVNVNMIETLYQNLIKTNSDVSISKYKKVYDQDYDILKEQDNEIFVFTDDKFFNMYNDWADYTITAWGKLYKKEIFQKLRFPVGKIHEDEFIVHEWLLLASRIVYTSCAYYCYLQRDNSIVSSYSEKRLAIFEALEERMKFFENKNQVLYYRTMYSYCYSILHHKEMIKKKNLLNKNDLLKKLNTKNRFYLKKLLFSKHIDIFRKIKIVILNIFK